MSQTVQEIMTPDPVCLAPAASVSDAALAMKDNDIGAVIVAGNDHIQGIVTDRDLVVRAIANGLEPEDTSLADVCTTDAISLAPDDSIEHAIDIVRDLAIRRIPVAENGRPVGIFSIGDLAADRDSDSALAEISEAPPNH